MVDIQLETERAANLRDAEKKAHSMFDEIASNLIRPGVMESTINQEILALGAKRHNVQTHWHRRVVRSGPNTLYPYTESPPDRMIAEDDIIFIDLGPVFEAWEADFARTYVLGHDPAKIRLRDALQPAWNATKTHFLAHPNITGAELYAFACQEAQKAGYDFGGTHAGHLVGNFPHERIPNDKITFFITKGNDGIMRSIDQKGHQRHWILEIHLIDREKQIGGFMEQLLTVE